MFILIVHATTTGLGSTKFSSPRGGEGVHTCSRSPQRQPSSASSRPLAGVRVFILGNGTPQLHARRHGSRPLAGVRVFIRITTITTFGGTTSPRSRPLAGVRVFIPCEDNNGEFAMVVFSSPRGGEGVHTPLQRGSSGRRGQACSRPLAGVRVFIPVCAPTRYARPDSKRSRPLAGVRVFILALLPPSLSSPSVLVPSRG